MVEALKPGGWLVVEENDYASALPDPNIDPATAALFLKGQNAFVEMWKAHGWDSEYGRRVFGQLRREGLVDVETAGRVFMWPGGSAGARWLRLTLRTRAGGNCQPRVADRGGGQLSHPALGHSRLRNDVPAMYGGLGTSASMMSHLQDWSRVGTVDPHICLKEGA